MHFQCVKLLAQKSGRVKFLTNFKSGHEQLTEPKKLKLAQVWPILTKNCHFFQQIFTAKIFTPKISTQKIVTQKIFTQEVSTQKNFTQKIFNHKIFTQIIFHPKKIHPKMFPKKKCSTKPFSPKKIVLVFLVIQSEMSTLVRQSCF